LINIKTLNEKWINTGKLTDEEIGTLFGVIEGKNDRLLAIKSIVSSIPKDHVSPYLVSQIDTIKRLTK